MVSRLARVFQQRRWRAATKRSQPTEGRGDEPTVKQQLAALTRRLEHLEKLVEGLQDSVYRESVRQQQEDRVRQPRRWM